VSRVESFTKTEEEEGEGDREEIQSVHELRVTDDSSSIKNYSFLSFSFFLSLFLSFSLPIYIYICMYEIHTNT
jgi:hypothetical protein